MLVRVMQEEASSILSCWGWFCCALSGLCEGKASLLEDEEHVE